MSMTLKKYKLGDLMDVTRGASLAGERYATEGDLIRLTLGNFDYDNCGFKENTSKDNIYYTGDINENFILNEGDVITPLTEQTPGLLGTTARIPESGKYIQSQDIALIKCKPELLDKNFAYYLLPSKIVKEQLAARAQQTKIRHTSPDKIKDCTVFIPSVGEQKKIAAVLRSIDDRIEINNRLCTRMEQTAREIYNYYFNNKHIPHNNWKVKTVGEIIMPLESGKRPAGGIDKTLKEGIPSLGAECIGRLGYFNYSSTPFIPTSYRASIHSGIINSNDILIYKDGAYVGKATLFKDGFPFEFATINEHVFLMRAKESIMQEYLFFTLLQDHYFEKMQVLGHKAAQPGLNQEDLKSIEISIPTESEIFNFHSIIEPLLSTLFNTAKNTHQLEETRQFLLPLLLSGQLLLN